MPFVCWEYLKENLQIIPDLGVEWAKKVLDRLKEKTERTIMKFKSPKEGKH